jgi:hypothetical protein
MNDIDKLAIVCLTIVVLVSVFAVSVYQVNDRVLMSKNIQEAISKGIDPISVRCSYSRIDDPVCIVFAATKDENVLQSVTPKK